MQSSWGPDPQAAYTRGNVYITALHKLDHDREQVQAVLLRLPGQYRVGVPPTERSLPKMVTPPIFLALRFLSRLGSPFPRFICCPFSFVLFEFDAVL